MVHDGLGGRLATRDGDPSVWPVPVYGQLFNLHIKLRYAIMYLLPDRLDRPSLSSHGQYS